MLEPAVAPALEPHSSHPHRAVSEAFRLLGAPRHHWDPHHPSLQIALTFRGSSLPPDVNARSFAMRKPGNSFTGPVTHFFSTCVLYSAKPDASLLPLSQRSRCSSVWASWSRTVPGQTLLILQSLSHDPCEAMPGPSPPDGRPAPSCWRFSPHRLLTGSFCLCFACKSCVPPRFLPSLTPAESPSRQGTHPYAAPREGRVPLPGAQGPLRPEAGRQARPRFRGGTCRGHGWLSGGCPAEASWVCSVPLWVLLELVLSTSTTWLPQEGSRHPESPGSLSGRSGRHSCFQWLW